MDSDHGAFILHEVHYHVFSFLTLEETKATSTVCRLWQDICNDRLLWKKLFLRYYPSSTAKTKPEFKNNYLFSFFLYVVTCFMSEYKHNN